jgi:hypothetical protein
MDYVTIITKHGTNLDIAYAKFGDTYVGGKGNASQVGFMQRIVGPGWDWAPIDPLHHDDIIKKLDAQVPGWEAKLKFTRVRQFEPLPNAPAEPAGGPSPAEATPTAATSPKEPPDVLEAGAATFRGRNAIYGDTFKLVGKTLAALFPKGITLKTAEDHARFHTLCWNVGKMQRYCANFAAGGHEDSAHDAMVYWAIQQYQDECLKKGGK